MKKGGDGGGVFGKGNFFRGKKFLFCKRQERGRAFLLFKKIIFSLFWGGRGG